MALETLQVAMDEAATLLGIELATVLAEQEQTVHHLGTIAVGGEDLAAYRVHTGADEKVGKGGIRFAPYESDADAEDDARELSWEMLVKLAARGHQGIFRGAKGVVNTGPLGRRQLEPHEKEHIALEFYRLMDEAGLAGAHIDVPAGDVGTNGLADIYADAYAADHPNDPYKAAVITGKSPENEGLEARAGATGLGVLSSQFALMSARGRKKASVALQGFGNVAAWYAYYASSDPLRRVQVNAISEREGMLSTDDPRGLPITEAMVRDIGDNKDWDTSASKLAALQGRILAEHPNMQLTFTPNSSAIIEYPCDYFVPASALKDVLTVETVQKLGARYGVIEAGNGTTTAAAHALMVRQGLDVVPDVLANGAGVDTSIKEWEVNIEIADGFASSMPDRETVEDWIDLSSQRLTRETIKTAADLGTLDLRVAIAAIALRNLIKARSTARV